jgi:hypothetical protein
MTRLCQISTVVGLIAVCALDAAALSDPEQERFLKQAKIVRAKELDVGITHSRRLTLTDGTLTHDAHFQIVDEHINAFSGRKSAEIDFRDSYRYNIAAYRIDRLLGLGMAPVSVKRRYGGRNGALTWWINDVLMMEADRRRGNIRPPRPGAWNHSMSKARLFQALIYNVDPNPGNTLIDKDWKVWIVDFTRSFRRFTEPRQQERIDHIDRRLWEAILALEEQQLYDSVGDILFNVEIRALVERRAALVNLVQERIGRHGEEGILCDESSHQPGAAEASARLN